MDPLSALVMSLPTRNSTVRMRVWRALKASGCGVLRDGVYVLPKAAPSAGLFAELESQVRESGGTAMTVDIDFRTPSQREQARRLFDRSAEYGEVVKEMATQKSALARLDKARAEGASQRFERVVERLASIDFFPGEAQAQAREALVAFQAEARRLHSHGEPRAFAGKVRRVDPRKFRGRVWATRREPWVDRLASAWLIKRFIDKEARFTWLETPPRCPRNAVGFDFDGAAFSHVGSLVTFEVLLASFGLESDAALAAIGSIVHFLDAGGIPVADARGVETLLRGLVQKSRNDDERISKANGVFDSLYAAYSAG